MLRRYQHIVSALFRAADVCVVVACWLASYWLRLYSPRLGAPGPLPPFEKYASLAPLVAVLWTAIFTLSGIYESGRMRGRKAEILMILKAHGLAMLAFVTIAYAYDEYKYSRLVMAYFGALAAFALAAFRFALRTSLRALRRRGYNLRHVLIVGEGPAVHQLIRWLDFFPELGMKVKGIVTHERSILAECLGKPVIGHFGELREVIEATRAEEVLIALRHDEQRQLTSLVDSVKDEPVSIRIVPDVHDYVTIGCNVEEFAGLPIVRLDDAPMDSWGILLKRATDVVASAIGLLILSPLLVALGVLVKLTSPGPVLYSQERMGLDGRTFKMLKFRSMRVDAEEHSGAVWAKQGDDRRTAFGAFLRRTSLDELPQLWNVLKGDMSLVGPRPERPVFVNQFRQSIPRYMLRHKVKAGITGWAQVNGWRGNTSLDSRIQCDLFYIQNWTFLLDLKILTMTLWKGFVNKNAY